MHRILLIAWCAIIATGPAAQAGRMSKACAARDLLVIAFIEQRGRAGDLPAATLGGLGLMQLEARLACMAGEEAQALAIYEDILFTGRVVRRVRS